MERKSHSGGDKKDKGEAQKPVKSSEKSSKERKREAASFAIAPPSSHPKKKSRTALHDEPSSSKSEKIPADKAASDGDILSILQKAEQSGGSKSNVETSILDVLKKFRVSKEEKVGITTYENVLTAAKTYPAYFRNNQVLEALLDIVRNCTNESSLKTLSQSGSTQSTTLAVFVINLLSHIYANVDEWPLSFVEIWMEDASLNRNWVDKLLCSYFVENLSASFGTKTPPPNLMLSDTLPATSTSMRREVDTEELANLLERNVGEKTSSCRYNGMEDSVENLICNSAREILQKKAPDVPKNLLKAISSACGLTGVRTLAVSRLEQWIHNPMCTRQAQQLLLSLCVNANCNTTTDAEVVVAISKLRIKAKTMVQFYCTAVREMVKENENNMRNVLSQVVYNELSLARNPNNMAVLGSIIPSSQESFTFLADIVLDLLQKKEDFLSAIRLILREIVRASRYDCNLVSFIDGLLKFRDISWRDAETRERAFKSVTELIIISMFLSLSPMVKEAASIRSDDRDLGVISNFHSTVSRIQEEALRWLYLVSPKMYLPSKKEYVISFNKIILKEPIADLQSRDSWPTDNEIRIFAKLSLQTPLAENSLIWVLFQGIPKELPILTLSEILDFAEGIIMKAATHNSLLPLNKLEIIELLFRLTQYKHPENITLPPGYEPPKLAISKLYWRVWVLLCVVAALNPTTLGKLAWDSYPTLKTFMEMCMTNHFSFPAPSATTADDILTAERQTSALEKQQILEFESHLAAASKNTITEKNSLLLTQLIRLDPLGNCRSPPAAVLTQLQGLNERLKLGHMLCKSRNPDFLVDLIQRNSQPTMPWLFELYAEGNLDLLPIQCLCEFLLQQNRLRKTLGPEKPRSSECTEKSPRKSKIPETFKEDMKALQLVKHIKAVLHGHSADSVREVLEYFFRRIASPDTQSRTQAQHAFNLLFSSADLPPHENWLADCIPNLGHFPEVQEIIITLLRQAIQYETEPLWIARYIEFLSTWGEMSVSTQADSEIDSIALDVATLVVERNSVIALVLSRHASTYDPLFNIFLSFLKKVREPQKESYKWCDGSEQVLLKWPGDQLEANMAIVIIHAIVIILASYSLHLSSSDQQKDTKSSTTEMRYKELLDLFFPRRKENSPKGFLLNTSEEAILYPDWIKLRMIRSDNSRLLAAALMDLTIEQLLLFVQSFGIPVKSMTALLLCTDKAIENDAVKVTAAIADAQYMNTLVEMQWSRGASGGKKFATLLKSLTRNSGEEEVVEEPQHKPRPMLCRKDIGTGVITPISSSISHLKLSKSSFNLPPKTDKVKSQISEVQNIKNLSAQLLSQTNYSHQSSLSTDLTKSVLANSVGHTLDTILNIEPCTLPNIANVQLPLMFDRNKSQLPCRPLLLTALIHESSWTTIEKCIEKFLGRFDQSHDPSAVLDLLASTITNPKLWQGTDKYQPKHQPHSSVFKLNEKQLVIMAEYIMEEMNYEETKNMKFSISQLLSSNVRTESTSTTTQGHTVQDRVKLWVQCCFSNSVAIDKTVDSLIKAKSNDSSVAKFLSHVYLEYPEIITKIGFTVESHLEEQGTSVLDNVTHSLIYAVSNVQPTKDFKKLASEVDQCLRKIAVHHPILLLRQLNLIKTLLEGRTHLEYGVFHSHHHHVPFQVFLGLLELMQSHMLSHMKTLESILVLYIKVFTNYGHQKDYSISLGRFSVFVQNFLRTNPEAMRQVLSVHYDALRELSKVKYYEELEPFQNLMNSLVPPSAGSELSFLTSESSEASINSLVTTEILSRVKNIRKPDGDEWVPILQELESLSTRHPALLNHFVDSLISLIHSESDVCRNQAFTLILKHMTSFPETSRLYLEPILKALHIKDSLTNNNLIKRFNEFIVLSQESGEGLLKEMFNMGVNSNNVNVLPAIVKAIEFLRIQKSQV